MDAMVYEVVAIKTSLYVHILPPPTHAQDRAAFSQRVREHIREVREWNAMIRATRNLFALRR